jgi:thymidylate synthase
MKQYQEALQYILDNGKVREDRTGHGTMSVFGMQMRFDLSKGFPAVTTKKLAWKAMVSELIWFIEGSSDERRLCEILHKSRDSKYKTIWTENAQAPYWKPKARFEGDLGRVYGVNWRSWLTPDGTTIDQLANLIGRIKKDPYSRRHILTAWNVAEVDEAMSLPPCHTFAQFYVQDNKLSCQMYQRSADFFLGVPFNIASYALFTHMLAQVCELEVGEFVHTFGDAHIYLNHIDAVKEQLQRQPHSLPTLKINKDVKDIDSFTMEDFSLENYTHDAPIKAPMAV